MTRTLGVVSLGTMPYGDALALQRAAAQARIDGAIDHDLLLLVEHPAVITLGRSTHQANLLADASVLADRGVEQFEVERGGDITFHGPGQLVGYPIIDLRAHREDLHWYLRQLEEVLTRALASLGIAAERRPTLTGVWTNGRKIASIGVHARNWVTWHGFALNVTTDLSYFDLIVPCGIEQVVMTSVARELGLDAGAGGNETNAEDVGAAEGAEMMQRTTTAVVAAFAEVFGLATRDESLEQLRIRT